MPKTKCPECHGLGHDVMISCPDCRGTGYDPNEDNPFAQCHTCHGEKKVEADICPKCNGHGEIELDYSNSTSDPELTPDGFCQCADCGTKATHVLVSYNHDILGSGIFYCSQHAFSNGREQCPCCYDYWIEFDGKEYLPTYPSGALDGEECCSEHP